MHLASCGLLLTGADSDSDDASEFGDDLLHKFARESRLQFPGVILKGGLLDNEHLRVLQRKK